VRAVADGIHAVWDASPWDGTTLPQSPTDSHRRGKRSTDCAVSRRAETATPYVPILLATSPLEAIRSAPTIIACTRPCLMTVAAMPSVVTVTGRPASASSHAVIRAPCRRGRVSSAYTSLADRAPLQVVLERVEPLRARFPRPVARQARVPQVLPIGVPSRSPYGGRSPSRRSRRRQPVTHRPPRSSQHAAIVTAPHGRGGSVFNRRKGVTLRPAATLLAPDEPWRMARACMRSCSCTQYRRCTLTERTGVPEKRRPERQ
jgi:hypothetical protein